ncbi:hypothetical protein [Mycobacteroides immunogenum]|uniref:Uncharacterized protein n=1 Tax=Mycobacteroides immunogenum TaxID=83262 RepID=A0A7V8LQV5_9MYCO|nr:hypothetical protein [Mycobacteroides immunogenum]KPG13701.1 hypothetical protein AN909_05395 [Mycobacteroides immunogenum]KPG14310.1 hypothetical protein AN908_07010 [Mycobacteroides immunogenum]KPG14378.1 hypothetical protein AN908_07465 [Mycobacteroides immunogenum]KPG17415.1 hypothetical protein AN910_04620 [Mycobacteroides immunogenum]KPG24001.1 hypothetical protein AN911_00540 [Mycobacteroides immunogenum]
MTTHHSELTFTEPSHIEFDTDITGTLYVDAIPAHQHEGYPAQLPSRVVIGKPGYFRWAMDATDAVELAESLIDAAHQLRKLHVA